jgi:hypothetical protein
MDTESPSTPAKLRKVSEEMSNSGGQKEGTKEVAKTPSIVVSKVGILDSTGISDQNILQKIKELQTLEKKLEQERRQLEVLEYHCNSFCRRTVKNLQQKKNLYKNGSKI